MQFQPHFCIYKEFLYVVSSLLVLPTCIVSECLHLKNGPVKYSQTIFFVKIYLEFLSNDEIHLKKLCKKYTYHSLLFSAYYVCGTFYDLAQCPLPFDTCIYVNSKSNQLYKPNFFISWQTARGLEACQIKALKLYIYICTSST